MSRFNREDLDALTSNELAAMHYGMREASEDAGANADLAHFVLRERMITEGASKLDTTDFTGTLKPGAWQHNLEDAPGLILALHSILTPEQLELAVIPSKPTPERLNQMGLNELLKLGGAVAETINDFRTSGRGDSTLKLTKKEAKDGSI